MRAIMKQMFRGIDTASSVKANSIKAHSFNEASGVKIFCGFAKLPELGLRPRLEFSDLIERPKSRALPRNIYVNQNNYINLLDVFK